MPIVRTLLALALLGGALGISRQKAEGLFKTTLKQTGTIYNSPKEYEYRFSIFLKNLNEIEAQVLEPKLDKKGRPLIGFSRSSLDKSKGLANATYEKAVNKFSFLTDIEFQNLYLMKPDVVFGNKEYLRKRQDPMYSFEYFKEQLEQYDDVGDDYNEYQNYFARDKESGKTR